MSEHSRTFNRRINIEDTNEKKFGGSGGVSCM